MTKPTEDHPYPEVDLAVAEANKILEKLQADAGNEPFVAVAALGFGMLKAIMECPNCPGRFRVPVVMVGGKWVTDNDPRSNWDTIACAHCNTLWTRPKGEKP
jgi:hypothetical protein